MKVFFSEGVTNMANSNYELNCEAAFRSLSFDLELKPLPTSHSCRERASFLFSWRSCDCERRNRSVAASPLKITASPRNTKLVAPRVSVSKTFLIMKSKQKQVSCDNL